MNRRRLAVLVLVTAALIGGPRSRISAQQTESETLQGRVVSRGTLEPISGVEVALTRLNPDMPQTPEALELAQNVASLMTQPVPIDPFLKPNAERLGLDPELVRPLSRIGAVTDSAGAFSFKGLLPGAYSLSARKEGLYVPSAGEYSTTMLELIRIENGRSPVPMELVFVKGGIISGRVRDPQGQPVSNIYVAGNPLSYPDGRAAILNSSSGKFTNDRGEFRLYWLPPGQYYIEATPKAPGSAVGPQDSWLRTFHQSASDPARAVPITVMDGAEISGIDIDFRTSSSPLFTISGTAINPFATLPTGGARGAAPGAVPDRSIGTFYLVPRELSMLDGVSPSFANAIPAASRPNGEFEIRNVKPGLYDLYASYLDLNKHRTFLDHVPVEVRSSNITGLSLTISAGSTIAAEVISEGSFSNTFKVESLHLNLSTKDTLPVLFSAIMTDLQFNKEGRLTAGNVPNLQYVASVSGLPSGAFVADIRQGNRSVYDEGIVVGPQAKPIQVVVNPAGASIEGRVQNAEHQPVQGAAVILVPPAARRKNADLFKIAKTGRDGRFSISGVMPGAYFIFALQQHPPRQPWLNSEFLAIYQDRWTSLDLHGSASSEVQLEPLSN